MEVIVIAGIIGGGVVALLWILYMVTVWLLFGRNNHL